MKNLGYRGKKRSKYVIMPNIVDIRYIYIYIDTDAQKIFFSQTILCWKSLSPYAVTDPTTVFFLSKYQK